MYEKCLSIELFIVTSLKWVKIVVGDVTKRRYRYKNRDYIPIFVVSNTVNTLNYLLVVFGDRKNV